MIGSSLLFVHDSKQSTIGMIDFGRAKKLPSDINITHDSHDPNDNYEDGYLIGIDSLINIFYELVQKN
jgi:1D-myo-inositol-triphosphate 3-kinase